ncbi:TlpA disulfide reductase family protein [Pseudomonas sp. S9]|uniref:TlpA disulfide reductase family protein n=1 Tax=Pseudomonas sp. S9 TaxID=686578 RepID=UPI0002557628|nr:TlpA disulfide reductase family protein [Pseudomonas sp. S9]
MLSVNLGPLTMSVAHLLLLGSLLVATLVGWWVGRNAGSNPENRLFLMFLVGVLGARCAFVVRYFEQFKSDPWQVIDLRDGGFIAWPGILLALLLGLYWLVRQPPMRRPLAMALVAGLLAWGSGSAVMRALEQGTRLPDVALTTQDGKAVELSDYVGKPLVVNLWATWCPPCRREMPVLAAAQERHAEVTFLFVNQGETEDEIKRFLNAGQLNMDNVLLDSHARLGPMLGSRALPTTVFYDAQGRQLGSHLGELSEASLLQVLDLFKKDDKQ